MEQGFDHLQLVYLLGVLILVAPGAAYALRNKSRSLRQAVLWLSITIALAYVYKIFGWPLGL